LAKIKKIDFGDMINRARGYVEKDDGKWGARFRYIIVDEFQDTASGAIKLIRAIGAQNPGCKLYFVGDDWQSIYRFNGSDVGLIQKFEETFTDGRVVSLGNNYRSFRNVVELGEAFITKNPYQRKKTVRSMQSLEKRNLILYLNKSELIEKFIRNACEWEKLKKADIFFLGRYKADQPKYLEVLSRKFKELNISFMTIHKSKGLEADFVFLLPPAELHFPSNISDDPILDLVAAPRENYDHAEERRLMYVAITRAKRQVFFIRPENEKRMPFFREIEEMLKMKETAYQLVPDTIV
jgi:DNA helicase-4